MQKETTIRISPDTFSEIEKIVAQSEAFVSVESYVNFALDTLLFGERGSREEGPDEQIRRRLKDLGYL